MADLSRLYNFLAGQIVKASEVNAELNQLVARVNALEADSLDSATADKLGLSQTGTVRRGKSIIATEESRTNTVYGVLPTPDRVSNLVLPTDGLIVVAYQALWKESVNGAANAALFLGANQLRYGFTGGSPLVTEAQCTTAANTYAPLSSSWRGLWPNMNGAAASPTFSDVATGQVVGFQDQPTLGEGGPCYIFASAGVYDISVQFKSSSGSVTAKERKLWAMALGF